MNGEFLRGLSEGVFSRLGELRAEQQRKDDQQKLQTIQTLAGLAGQVEPESLPALMSHLGDVIGIKGKMRGFWNAFSGIPDRTIEDQLGTKLNELSSQFAGPETARQSRESYKQTLLQPYREAGTRPRTVAGLDYMRPPDLQGKIVFRDPQAQIEAARQFESDQLEKRLSQQAWIEEQRERLRSTLESRREAARTELEEKRQQATERRQQLRDSRQITARFAAAGAAPPVAKELGDYYAGLTEALSPTASKWESAQTKKAQRPPKAQRVTSSGAGTDRKMALAVEGFERLKQALIDATARGDEAMMIQLRKRLQTMATNLAAKYGDRLEVGSGEWPYQKPRTSQAPAEPIPPPTVEPLPGGIRLTTPAPALNERQRSIFDDIKRERPDATDSQILDYMQKKGWL